MTKLIIRRMFTRQPRIYLKMFVCLVCSVILITCILIYRDSDKYGREQYLHKVTNDADILITNISNQDVSLFPLENTEYVYENNTLYIKFTNTQDVSHYIRKLRNVISAYELSCEITNYYHLRSDETPQLTLLLICVVIVLAVFSLLSMFFMYRTFLQTRNQDIHILYSLGASAAQVSKLLRVEMYLLSGSALLIGTVIANILMAVCIDRFLNIENPSFSHMEYHFSIWSFVIVAGVVMLIHAIAAEQGEKKYQLVGATTVKKAFHPLISINKSSLLNFYRKVSWKRERIHSLVCGLITVPLILIVSFVSVYMGIYTPNRNDSLIGDIVLYQNMESDYIMTVDDFDLLLTNHEQISSFSYYVYRTDYSIYLSHRHLDLITSHVSEEGTEITMAEYGIMTEEQFASICDPTFLGMEKICVVPDGFGFKTGETVSLDNGQTHFELTVGGVYDFSGKRDQLKMFPVYVQRNTYEWLTETQAVPYVVSLFLTDDQDANTVLESLHIGDAYTVRNNLNNQKDYESLYKGISFFLFILSLFIALVESMMLYSYISLHMEENKHEIITLQRLGCTLRKLYLLFINRYLSRCFVFIVIGLIMSVMPIQLMLVGIRKSFVLNAVTVFPSVFVIVFLILVYTVTVTLTVRKITQNSEV